MEANDFGYYHAAHPVFAMFGASYAGDGNYLPNVASLTGQSDSIMDGVSMDYMYNQTYADRYVDFINPTTGKLIFKSQEGRGRGVTYTDSATGYRTIYNTFFFGAMEERNSNCTKAQLMATFMTYLGYPPEHITAQKGNVNTAVANPEDVLFINDSPGNYMRKIYSTYGSDLVCTMKASSSGPTDAAYTIYAFLGEAGPADVTLEPYDTGISCFPFPPANGTPAPPPYTVANNIGYRWILGVPAFPVTPLAPCTVFSYPYLAPGTYTLQGLIFDSGTASTEVPLSITNAVTIVVE